MKKEVVVVEAGVAVGMGAEAMEREAKKTQQTPMGQNSMYVPLHPAHLLYRVIVELKRILARVLRR